LPLRSSLGTLEGGLIDGGRGNSRVFANRYSKSDSYHLDKKLSNRVNMSLDELLNNKDELKAIMRG
jgi:hypothetical protein